MSVASTFSNCLLVGGIFHDYRAQQVELINPIRELVLDFSINRHIPPESSPHLMTSQVGPRGVVETVMEMPIRLFFYFCTHAN